MKKNKIVIQILVFVFIALGFIACNEDFSSIESDVVNGDNATSFNVVEEQFDVITYTNKLGPVQTNNTILNTLGVYDDNYGRVTSSLLTQLNLSSYNPDFGEEVAIDSVVLTLPFFNSSESVDDNGSITYDVDSVINIGNRIKLHIFESNYFLRNFDPNNELNETQDFFSNMSASSTEDIGVTEIEGEELVFVDHDLNDNQVIIDNIVEINANGFELKGKDSEGNPFVLERQGPGIRIKLHPEFWKEKIIDQQGSEVLSNVSNFIEFFRGLYIKAEPVENKGSLVFLNTAAQSSNITIYYSRLNTSTTEDTSDRENTTFQISLGPNRVNFFDNNFPSIVDGNDAIGDSRLFLKGGEGAIAKIKLFNGEDIDGDNSVDNIFEQFKKEFVETDSDGNFIESKRLINEANLVFYVDQGAVNADEEPNRLYIYDAVNQNALLDYFADASFNSAIPEVSIINHLGVLQRVDDEPNGKGIKYKMRITEHINNLLLRDSTNVELGLAVSLNVNLEQTGTQSTVQTPGNSDVRVPSSAVLNPRGTVLHGNVSEDLAKRVQLEIFYTEPKN